MNIEVGKEEFTINKLVTTKKELVSVHTDFIVPDAKPDILNTINCKGNTVIYKKEISDGKVKIEGMIDTYIMYLPDSKDDRIRGLNFSIDFSENIDIPNLTESMDVAICHALKNIECKVLNGRKISLRANIEFDIKVYLNDSIQIINSINNIDDIQILNQSYKIDEVVGKGKTIVYAKDTFNINQNDELAEILNVNLDIINKDVKKSYNKVLSKADARINIMYLTEDNRIENVSAQIPVVGFVDMQNISEENICNVNYEIKNMIVRPNSKDEHSIYVDLEIEVEVMTYSKREISLIQDLYSPSCNLQYTQKEISSLSDRSENVKNLVIKEQVNIDGLESNKLLDVEINAQILTTSITNINIMYTGEIDLNFIFMKENILSSRRLKLPFEVTQENNHLVDNIDVVTSIIINSTDFFVKEFGSVEANIELSILTQVSKNVKMSIIDNIEYIDVVNNDEDYDSLILYIVRKGDSLWKIAKKFNSTIEEIARLNGVDNLEKINIGQKLYIPKFNCSKREFINAR